MESHNPFHGSSHHQAVAEVQKNQWIFSDVSDDPNERTATVVKALNDLGTTDDLVHVNTNIYIYINISYPLVI